MTQRSTSKTQWTGALALALLGVVMAGPVPAQAERQEGWDRHGDIRHFHERDVARWRGGHWVHGRHGGRLGWWWIAGGAWYFYAAPVYPYPNPYVPPAVLATPPPGPAPAPSWYYCRSAQGYYPYVPACPEGWLPVTPQPPG